MLDRSVPAFGAESALNAVLIVLLLVAPLVAYGLDEPFYVSLASRVAILALAGVGLNLALGYGGLVSFGHAAFFGLGGYAAGILAHHAFEGLPVIGWPIAIEGSDLVLVLWPAAIVLAALAACLIGAISLRTSGVYFIMITLAFAQMIFYLAVSIPAYGGQDGLPLYLQNRLPGLDLGDDLQFFAVCFMLLLLALFLSARIVGSRFGAALECARQNERRLAAVGIAPYPIKFFAFVLSAMITGLAGALYVELNGFVSPAMLSVAPVRRDHDLRHSWRRRPTVRAGRGCRAVRPAREPGRRRHRALAADPRAGAAGGRAVRARRPDRPFGGARAP